MRRQSCCMSRGFRLIEDLLYFESSSACRNGPQDHISCAIPNDGGSDGRQNGNPALGNIRVSREDENVDRFPSRIHVS
jgi:hypothetical protein